MSVPTIFVHTAKLPPGTGVALFGERLPFTKRRGVVATFVRRFPLIIPSPCLPSGENEEQGQGCGKPPHGEMIDP